MNTPAKTPEGRLRVGCILRAREAGHPAQWVRDLAHDIFGVPSTEDLCLTVLDKPQLVQLRRRIGELLGDPPLPTRRGPRGTGHRAQRDRTGVVTYLASREQRDLILALGAEIFGSGEAPAFRAFLVGMTGKSDCRTLASNQASKVIEALTAMQRRGWRPRGMTGKAATGSPHSTSEVQP